MRLIDADALRHWIEGECKSPSIPRSEVAFGRRILMHMELMGHEDVQLVVHGEWVGVNAYCDHLNEEAKANGKTERYLPSGMVIGVYCNQCWCRADKKSDFCPSCGADMR